MRSYEINYGGKELPGLIERFARDINYILKEVEILEATEQALSEFISNSVEELNQDNSRGHVWLNRFNARQRGQDAFYIQFNPTSAEKARVSFIQTAIGEGRLLSKKIRFFDRDCCWQLPYIEKEVIPFLESIFTKFGFEIIKENEPLS